MDPRQYAIEATPDVRIVAITDPAGVNLKPCKRCVPLTAKSLDIFFADAAPLSIAASHANNKARALR
jgi:hypothetical protein